MRSLLMQGSGVPQGVTLLSPQDQPILKLDLPTGLLDAITAFQNGNPQAGTLTAVKYMRTTNGSPDVVVEDDSPLPDQMNLVTFSHTVSTIWIKSANIVTHQIVATLAPVASSGPKPVPGPVPSPAPGPVLEQTR
jgi:hypothetical protein